MPNSGVKTKHSTDGKALLITYFSSTTNNTHRFVKKLGMRSARIPIYRYEEPLIVDEPHVLIVPTYGGGVGMVGENSRPVPKQVIHFLNEKQNRDYLRGVIASGNLNFGPDFCLAGDVIAAKCKVPYLYRFEMMGTEHDVERVKEGLAEFKQALIDEGKWD